MINKKLIWIIDDDLIFTKILARFIKQNKADSETVVHPNGLTALEKLRELLLKRDALPGLIFLDIRMPLMDGWDFMEAFHQLELNREKPDIYIVSSSRSVLDLEKQQEYPAIKDYLLKPIEEDRIRKIIT